MQEHDKIKVLYLPRWYPNKFDPMPGLFIQRHAEAANLFCNIAVVYVHAVDSKVQDKKYDIQTTIINNVPTIKVYYRNPVVHLPIVSQFIKAIRFYKANFKGIAEMNKKTKGFDLVHIHILSRLGVLGLYFKWFHGKSFLISEHWSRYLSLTGNFNGFFRKFITKIVVKNASAVTTVTQNLANAMQSHKLKNDNYVVLPNVISPEFLEQKTLEQKNHLKTNIVHVSCFEDKSKNISGILKVIKRLAERRNDFHFTLVGDGMDFRRMKDLAESLNLGANELSFTGLLEDKSLVNEMNNADALLIFSNYENLPVVINEAFSLGIPVIATRVGGIPEVVNSENGILINSGDENALYHAIEKILDGSIKFDNTKIKNKARSDFSMDTIGKQLLKLYNNSINK